jgi:hypothetical protein
MGMTYEQMMELAEQLGAVSQGVSAEVIDAMPTWTYRGCKQRGSVLQRVPVRRGGRGHATDVAVHAYVSQGLYR